MPTHNAREQVNRWLSQIESNGAAFSLDRNGQCQLVAEGGTTCVVLVPNDASAQFCLYSHLAGIIEPLNVNAYERLLHLNLLGMGTKGTTLGFDQDARSLVLSYTHDIENIDSAAFGRILQNFFDIADELEKQVANILNESNRPATNFDAQASDLPVQPSSFV